MLIRRFALKITGLGLFFMVCTAVNGQTATDSIKAVIRSLFLGMKQCDSELVKKAFADSAVLQTVSKTGTGEITVRSETAGAFAAAVKSLQKGDADERIHFETIKINGPLAVVWTPYEFYYKGQFSHCGVNSFQLVRFKEGWRIQYLIDTRQKQGCAVQ